MFVLITYDVNTETREGKKRLRRIAKICQNYGLRVQNSVFEFEVDSGLLLKIKDQLFRVYNSETDSLRFYTIGKERGDKVGHYGAKPSFDVTDTLIV